MSVDVIDVPDRHRFEADLDHVRELGKVTD